MTHLKSYTMFTKDALQEVPLVGRVAYEGNGRLAALQTVFSPDDAIEIEIERYHFKDNRSILRRINRVRRLHNLAGN